jgi:hypothetical protein
VEHAYALLCIPSVLFEEPRHAGGETEARLVAASEITNSDSPRGYFLEPLTAAEAALAAGRGGRVFFAEAREIVLDSSA